MGMVLLIVLVIVLLGTVPIYRHSRKWGYRPAGGVSLLVVILVILLLMEMIPWSYGPTPAVVVPR